MGTGEFNAGVTLRFTSISFRESRNPPCPFMLQKLEMSVGLMGNLGLMRGPQLETSMTERLLNFV